MKNLQTTSYTCKFMFMSLFIWFSVSGLLFDGIKCANLTLMCSSFQEKLWVYIVSSTFELSKRGSVSPCVHHSWTHRPMCICYWGKHLQTFFSKFSHCYWSWFQCDAFKEHTLTVSFSFCSSSGLTVFFNLESLNHRRACPKNVYSLKGQKEDVKRVYILYLHYIIYLFMLLSKRTTFWYGQWFCGDKARGLKTCIICTIFFSFSFF